LNSRKSQSHERYSLTTTSTANVNVSSLFR